MEDLSTGVKFKLRYQVVSHIKIRSKDHSRLLQRPQARTSLVCSRNSMLVNEAGCSGLGEEWSEIRSES